MLYSKWSGDKAYSVHIDATSKSNQAGLLV